LPLRLCLQVGSQGIVLASYGTARFADRLFVNRKRLPAEDTATGVERVEVGSVFYPCRLLPWLARDTWILLVNETRTFRDGRTLSRIG
jgi:hypothetical protein